MGLDIFALRNATLVEPQPAEDDDSAYDQGWHRAWVNDDFPGRNDGRPTGFYEADEDLRFRAGSYSGYNRWREWLSETMLGVAPEVVWGDPAAFAGRPFVELIHFADNEGLIGPDTAAKLAEDFRQHEDKARAATSADDTANGDYYYFATYQNFRAAFEMAAEDGLVQFC